MNSKRFLIIGGIILLGLAIAGTIIPRGEILGDKWSMTKGENIAHAILGIVALAGAYFTSDKVQKMLTRAVAVVAIFFTLFGFLVAGTPPPNTFGVANLENPYDNILHLVVGIWAGYVGFFTKAGIAKVNINAKS